jgi:murein DD-endopeptidase MepM/ murein hydrolase activator NlpD
VIRQSNGLSQVYAHLAPGSVSVRVGERVETGDVVGRLGNSGGSLAPHLHFHVVNGPHAETSDGFPFILNRFEVAGRTNLDAMVAAIGGQPGLPTRDRLRPVLHQDELPLGFTIVDF